MTDKWRHYVKMTSSCYVATQSIQELLRTLFEIKMRKIMVRKKIIIDLNEDGIENPSLEITICHHSASLVMPNDDPRVEFCISPDSNRVLSLLFLHNK